MAGQYSLQLIVDSALVTLIWMVQTIVYPSFYSIETSRFHSWHKSYSARIAIIVGPLMLLQLGLELFLLMTGKPQWIRLLIITSIWVTTATFSVPCHYKLQSIGRDNDTIRHLIHTNWIRTMLWSALWLLSIQNLISL